MKGWTPSGVEIKLAPWQAQIVADFAAGYRITIERGRRNGQAIVMATLAHYAEHPEQLTAELKHAGFA